MGRPKGFERKDVIEKATAVFWQKGFAETSLQDLERATGVNKSGLYSEFKDKQELFIACLEHYVLINSSLHQLRKDPQGWENIENFLATPPSNSDLSGCFCVNTMREISTLPPEAHKLVSEYNNTVESLLVRNLAAAGITAAHALAGVIMAFNSGNCLSQTADSTGPNQERIGAFLNLLRQPFSTVTAHTDSW